MNEINIPNFKTLRLVHAIFDYNGTVAKDGKLNPLTKERIMQLAERYKVHIITADTFGSVARECSDLDAKVVVLQSSDHTSEKGAYIQSLGASSCVAFGNGANDVMMLQKAALGIGLIQEEGCALATLQASDIVCRSIDDAIELLLYPKRLIATLRR